MSAEELRTGAAWASVYLAGVVFVGHGFYGVYLNWKLYGFRRGAELPRRDDEWTEEHFTAEAGPWLARHRRRRRRDRRVWIGCLVGGNLLYLLLKP
ncbi:MAG TPA: hypothetical protein VEY30_06115 [Myxococcaceae bacterium]|nr:hypothetical protein [Myxococcaceae bacterium]